MDNPPPPLSKPIRVIVITGCRSDFGLVAPIISALLEINQISERVETLVFATGNHLSATFGRTLSLVEEKFAITGTWDTFLSAGDNRSVAMGMGLLAVLSSNDLARELPDALIVTGDRTEMLPPAQSAAILGIPVAHIGGGETTLGAIDEKIRSCLTAFATWHFVGLPEFRDKVIRQGADPEMVFVTGESAIDTLLSQKDLDEETLIRTYGFVPDRSSVLVTYHPETLLEDCGYSGFEALIDSFDDHFGHILCSCPNADAGSMKIFERLKSFVHGHQKRVLIQPLGSRHWAALLRRVGVIIGNSSSALIEAPSFKLPAVNIGNRQGGRFRTANVIDALPNHQSIRQALKKAMSNEFRDSLNEIINPYGDGNSGKKIANLLVQQIKKRRMHKAES